MASDDRVLLYKFEIPITECYGLFDYLNICKFDASAMFYGYSGVAKAVEEMALLKS